MKQHRKQPITPTIKKTKYEMNIHVPGQTSSFSGRPSCGTRTGRVTATAMTILRRPTLKKCFATCSEGTCPNRGGLPLLSKVVGFTRLWLFPHAEDPANLPCASSAFLGPSFACPVRTAFLLDMAANRKGR